MNQALGIQGIVMDETYDRPPGRAAATRGSAVKAQPETLPQEQPFRFTPSHQAHMIEWLEQVQSTGPDEFVPCERYVPPPSMEAVEAALRQGRFGVTKRHRLLILWWIGRHSIEAKRRGGCVCELRRG
jgi:hypothetical protein